MAIAAESSGFNMENRDRISNITCCKKSDQTWMKWMDFGQRLGCHQKPERSFFIKGYQLPVCARCTGVFIGYLATLFLLPATKGKEKIANIVAAAGCITMLTDWSLQALKIKESTNKRRFLTGIIGGLGIMTLWIHLISKIARLYVRKPAKNAA